MGDELDQLRFINAQLSAELAVMESRIRAMVARCEMWEAMAQNERRLAVTWQQTAIAAIDKSNKLEGKK